MVTCPATTPSTPQVLVDVPLGSVSPLGLDTHIYGFAPLKTPACKIL